MALAVRGDAAGFYTLAKRGFSSQVGRSAEERGREERRHLTDATSEGNEAVRGELARHACLGDDEQNHQLGLVLPLWAGRCLRRPHLAQHTSTGRKEISA